MCNCIPINIILQDKVLPLLLQVKHNPFRHWNLHNHESNMFSRHKPESELFRGDTSYCLKTIIHQDLLLGVLVPGRYKRNKLSNSIFCTFRSRDKGIFQGIPVSRSGGRNWHLVSINPIYWPCPKIHPYLI